MSRSVHSRTSSGRTKRRKGRHGPPFIQLFHWMIDLPVWHSLSPRAVVAYLELARRYNGSNNGWLHLSVRELARAWNWSRASAGRAIEELVEKGFVEITRASGFNVKDRKGQAAEYRLTVFFCDRTREAASKTFTKWKPERPAHEALKNISRSQSRATTVSLVRPSLQNIQENASTVSPVRPWRRFSGISRSHP
jgi:DNA-binding transcriptional regulator YhcF (GntR family)